MIVTARRLARASPSRPRQADLRRATSTAYYALFHAMAKDVADLFAGAGPNRPDKAWRHAYRALDHGTAKNACAEVRNLRFPAEIVACADTFVMLQKARHSADYDPAHRFRREQVMTLVSAADHAIRSLRSAQGRDRRAFAIQLLLRKRPD